jgi:cell filamentation protein, protein adenylyltransferase
MPPDPYAYPGTGTLINKENIGDADVLERFERISAAQRFAEGLPHVALAATGYRQLHQHLFQDVYPWAGQYRTVDITKADSQFCRAEFIKAQLDKRFQAIAGDAALKGASAAQFAERAGEHISEINAIHPFREGNGRALRAFLVVLARRCGYDIDLRRIDPAKWNEASRHSFLSGDPASLAAVIAAAIIEPQRQSPRARASRSSSPKMGR